MNRMFSLPKIPRESWLLFLLLVLAFVIRLYRLEGLSLYNDEITTSVRISHPFWETVSLLRHSPFPPLYYVILKLWSNIFGDSEWALRYPSVIFSGLTVIVVYKLGQELFNKNVGLIAASLLTFSAFAIQHAQFAKMYGLFWLFSALSFLYFFRFLRDPSHRSWMGYVVFSILNCYTMYIGYVILLTQNVIFVLKRDRTQWKKWAAGQLAVLLICLPWGIWFLCSSHETWSASSKSESFNHFDYLLRSLFFMIGSAQEIWTVEKLSQFTLKLNVWKINLFLYAFLTVFLLAGILAAFFKKAEIRGGVMARRLDLLLWLVISTAVYLIYAVFFIDINLASRYLGFLQVPIFLLIASQVDSLKGLIKKALICLLLILAMTNTVFHFTDSFKYPRQDWRSFARDLSQVVGKDDVIVSLMGVSRLDYYYKGDPKQIFQMPLYECYTALLEERGIVKENVNSIFVLYRKRSPPDVWLKGFYLDGTYSYGGIGFMRFRRLQSVHSSNR